MRRLICYSFAATNADVMLRLRQSLKLLPLFLVAVVFWAPIEAFAQPYALINCGTGLVADNLGITSDNASIWQNYLSFNNNQKWWAHRTQSIYIGRFESYSASKHMEPYSHSTSSGTTIVQIGHSDAFGEWNTVGSDSCGGNPTMIMYNQGSPGSWLCLTAPNSNLPGVLTSSSCNGSSLQRWKVYNFYTGTYVSAGFF